MKTARLFFISALLLCLATPPALADPPLPARKETSLESVREKLEDTRAAVSATEGRMRKAESALKTVGKDLAVTAESVRRNQDSLADIARAQKSLAAEKSEIEARLEKNYGSVARTIIAARRLESLPSELLILRPGAPLETAQAALVLQSVLPALNRQNQALAADLTRLDELAARYEDNRIKAQAAQDRLNEENARLQALLDERQKNFAALEGDYKDQTARAEELARQARSLEDLVSRIRTAAPDGEERTASGGAKTGRRPEAARNLPALGKGLLPVSGPVLVGYGEKTEIGSESEGVSVGAVPGALVVAPVGGVVKFAGAFKNYGQLIIIEHRKGFHSLIAGLGNPGVSVGQRVNAGEPLGYMSGTSSQGGAARLYYEVRQNGQPVDPARLIPGLKS